ncbi:hypothetical protein COCSADRAFT_31820 [Bipolaris sorokiniana ND90Pr]|uniref:Uncharacterized protein n=1 Tax=Cochliobolus sativus (strain ND90Pr / ATCC 201652) TaxID=665912 RepID=M2RR46_COCSN|nr:uncharacterized protein COCSADRAFT_31820 [Bipolaris sorokiniana ND90Pr]EMD69044.1 hypothetical protein COCSADRAFT_31820 [Bipolaris sorokiniana ND90Pr]
MPKGNEMTFRCKRCKEKGLYCFMDTATGRYAGCISVKADCSLFVTEKEWEKVEADKLTRLRLEVAETEALERSYANRDHAILSL